MSNREKKLFIKRFYPAGNYTWTVPAGCTEVDVFLVGGGGGAFDLSAGGGGYTKTYKNDTSGYRDGDAIRVTPGQSIPIIVGKGGMSVLSTFENRLYRRQGKQLRQHQLQEYRIWRWWLWRRSGRWCLCQRAGSW